MGDLQEMAAQLCESVSAVTGRIAAVSDRDSMIASAGGSRRELQDKSISEPLEKLISSRKAYQYLPDSAMLSPVADSDKFHLITAVPIINQGDLIGSVMLLGQEEAVYSTEKELTLMETAAHFLGQQLDP